MPRVPEQASRPAIVAPPAGGIWRVGRWPNPLAFPPPPSPLPKSEAPILGGGRFDDPEGSYSTLYAATTAACAYGETISVYRRREGLLQKIDAYLEGEPDEAYDPPLVQGVVPEDFLSGRAIGLAPVNAASRFVDMADPGTHSDATRRLAALLNTHGLAEFDRGVVMSQDRRLTRPTGRAYYDLRAARAEPWAGLRYESRHREGWECWAVWDGGVILGLETRIYPIDPNSPALGEAASIVGVEIPGATLRMFR